MATEPTDSEISPAPQRKPGWFARVPLWARIVVPVVLVAGIAAAIVVPLVQSRAAAGPAEATESACRSEVLAELESHDMVAREVSFYEVTTTDVDVYLARGDTAFSPSDGEGDERRLRFRCTARFEDDVMQSPTIRFSEPISAD
jgi:hypothetical protein